MLEKYKKLPKAWTLILRYGQLNFDQSNIDINVIDIGCRVGTTVLKLKQMNYNPVGIDIDKKYVLEAQKYTECPIYQMNANNILFDDGFFDIIICTETLEHVPNQLETLKEFHRILDDEGKIFLSVPNPYHIPRMVYPKHFVTAGLLSVHLSVVDLTQYLSLFEMCNLKVIHWEGFPNRWIFPRWKRIGILLDKIIGKRMNRFKQNLFFELMKK